MPIPGDDRAFSLQAQIEEVERELALRANVYPKFIHNRTMTASAADYPDRPIRVIVSVPAGGGVDTITRIVTDKMRAALGQPLSVAIADLNGDGHPDIAIADGPSAGVIMQDAASLGTFSPVVQVGF